MPAVSLPGVFNLQSFTDAGLPAASYRLYTYVPGTTTQKVAYTEPTGTTSQTYVSDGIGGVYIALNARGELPAPLFLQAGGYDIALKTPAGAAVWTRRAIGQDDNATTLDAALRADLASTANDKGASLIGWLRALTSAVATTVYRWMSWQNPCVFEWMTTAQIADYQARTAVTNMAGALDLTAPIQAAIYASYASGQSLYFPPGAAKVTGLQVPTNSANYEDRGDAWCMYGAGAPQPFVREPRSGTLLISQTDAPVLRYQQRRSMPTAGGNAKVRGIRFEQRNTGATSAVVLWDSMSEDAEFSNNAILQFGTGQGFETTYQIKGNIYRNFALYGGYFSSTKSSAGIGFNIPSAADSGLLTVRKNTARSFLWGYVHGDGTNDSSGALFEQNECSDCTNGFWNKANITAAAFLSNYTEGITGTVLKDEGTMTKILGGMHYVGFSIGIDSSANSNYGTLIEGNYLETAGPNCTLIKVASGGPNKTVRSNHLLFSTSGGSVVGVVGIELSGLDPRLDLSSNAFLPREAWVGGAGTTKILDSSTSTPSSSRAKGGIGLAVAQQGANEFPSLNQVALSIATLDAITATVSSGTIMADHGGWYDVTFAGATTVSKIADGGQEGRIVWLASTNGNTTWSHNANLKLSGATNWTPGANGGLLVLRVYGQSGGFVNAREIARVAY